MSEKVKVAMLSEIIPGKVKVVTVLGEDIALFNISGKICATSNSCAHQGGPLNEGSVEGNLITCPWHGWRFDVTTGDCAQVAHANIKTYKTEVQGNDVFIEI